jgi:ArsR family transcriptional regulator
VLAQAGIVGREKAGVHVRYFIADEGVFELCELVCGSLRDQATELDRLFAEDAA